MELLGGLIAAGLVAAAPAVPGLRSVAKAVMTGGMAVADATVAVAAVVTHQVGDLVTHVRSADDGETVVDGETVTATAVDTVPAGDEFQTDTVDAATGQAGEEVQPVPAPLQSGDVSSATPGTAQIQPAAVDDLAQINGIGPKVASLLQEAGIASFAALAATSVERLREILDLSLIHIFLGASFSACA